MKGTIIDKDKKEVGEVDLSDEIFAAKPNIALIYEAVKMQRANRREGTASTRTHGSVSGTTAKMYRQKGTGRARHGDQRANIFVGGGKSFGPHPRDYGYSIPKRARRGAFAAALALKMQEGKLLIVKDLSVPEVSTKRAAALLKGLGVVGALIVLDGADDVLAKSVRNLRGMKLLRWDGVGTYDLMRYEHVVITPEALEKLQGTMLSRV